MKLVCSLSNGNHESVLEDVQNVAEEELDRELTEKELKIVEDKIGDYINWYEAIRLALNEAVNLQKNQKRLQKLKYDG